MKVTIIFKNLLSLLADFANGLFAVLLASWITGAELLWWHGLIGIVLAMSPDVDALGEFIKRGKVSASKTHVQDHRDLLHFPIIFVLAGFLMTYLFEYWGLVFLIAVVLHFINDLYGTGWGIKILWPYSKNNYKLLGRRVNLLKQLIDEKDIWNTLPQSERKLRLIVSWRPTELPTYITQYGFDDWIEKIYLRVNWISVIEYALFAIALVLYVTVVSK